MIAMIPIIREPSWAADLRKPAGPVERETYKRCGASLPASAQEPPPYRLGKQWLVLDGGWM